MSTLAVQFSTQPKVPLVKTALHALVLGVLYGFLMWWCATRPGSGPPAFIWPCAGLVIGFLCLRPRAEWPVHLASVFIFGVIATDAVWGSPFIGVVYMIGDTIEYIVGASLFMRATNGRIDFDRVSDVSAMFAYVVGVAAGLSAFFGALNGVLLFDRPFWSEFRVWWIANGAGDVLVFPMVLAVAAAYRNDGMRVVGRLRPVDWLLIFGTIVVVSVVSTTEVTHADHLAPYLFIAIPALLWVTFHGGLAVATVLGFICACIAYFFAAARLGPTARTYGNFAETAIQLQAAIACISSSSLYLSALFSSWRHQVRETERVSNELHESRKFEAIGQVTGGVAHDFNNVLFAVEGYSDLAEESIRAGATDQALGQITAIRRAAGRGRSLTGQVFTLTRSSLIEPVAVPLAGVVDDVISLFAVDVAKDVVIRRTGDIDATAAGDAVLIHQIIMNLVSNAMRATTHGSIDIDVDLERIDTTRSTSAGVLVPGEYVRITIRDTGTGIDRTVMERMFEPFFSASKSGTGLGMTIVTRNLKAHGGGMQIESIVGRGTTARVYLPALMHSEVASAPAPSLPYGDGQIVLVVDDNASLLALAEELIARIGYEPIGFEDRTRALRAFASAPHRFDAVVVDERLRGRSGMELIRELRALRRDLPAVLVTGAHPGQLAEEAAGLGVVGPVLKPLAGGELARALDQAIHAAKPPNL